MKNQHASKQWIIVPIYLLSMVTTLVSQEETNLSEEEIYELSPFVVETGEDEGYQATSTLAGTRVRTDLKDLASSVSVVTKQFIRDTGVTGSEDLLLYTTNTEVGGLGGNFSGLSNQQGVNEQHSLLTPSTNTRIRGLDAANSARNYFPTNIPWDAYNVDRIDLQRGPNSILFGVGSPAGIVNTSTIIPNFVNAISFENRIGSYGSVRNTLDINYVLIPETLAVRVAALSDREKFKQYPAFEDDDRIFATVAFTPDWFGKDASTEFRASFERGTIDANRPRMVPPIDQITPFFDPNGLNRRVFDPAWAFFYAAVLDRGNESYSSKNPHRNEPWLGCEQDSVMENALTLFNDNGVPGWTDFSAAGANTFFGIDKNGNIDHSINGYTFGRRMDIAAFNEYSKNANADNPDLYPAAAKNFYKDKVLSDPSVFDFYNNLFDGDNKREWSDWSAYNVSVAQTFFKNRLGVELVYDYQDYEQGYENLLGGRTFISVDINAYTNNSPTFYDTEPDATDADPSTVTGGDPNPNAGRAYISGNGSGKGRSEEVERENLRVTAFAELRGSDFFADNSFLAKLIGRNVFTGLYSRDERNMFNRSWNLFSPDYTYPESQGLSTGISDVPRRLPFAVYLSDDLRNTDSASGLHLDRMKSYLNPYGTATVRYFDGTWNSTVDPAAPYSLPFNNAASTQSENPSNYVGWTTQDVRILNARMGDKDELYSAAEKITQVLDSQAVTWQGYLWDGLLVPTVGWRKDKIETWGANGVKDPITDVPTIHFDNPKDEITESEGETTTWGVVGHMPEWVNRKLPGELALSFFYNSSNNFNAVNRVGFDTRPLPNPEGESEDYGFVVRTLNNRLTLKVTAYKTKVTDANIPGGNALGDNTFFLKNIEAWGTAGCFAHELFWAGELPGKDGFSNYGLVDEGYWGKEGWASAPFSEEALNHPSNQKLFAAIQDWYATMPDQDFFDRYGFPIDRSKANGTLDDRRTMIENGNWNPYNEIGQLQPSNGGKVNGLDPVGTINQESKGVEFELTAQVTKGWNLIVNASKTKAKRTELGESMVNFIEYQYERFQGPAGDLRLWWGGDLTIRQHYDANIYQAYLFQLDANGSDASEVRPWRFNVTSNYEFTEGVLEGAHMGIAYRWQDDIILGYRLNEDNTKMDVNSPIKGGAEDALDAWIGYSRTLPKGIRWHIQLNLRNIGDDWRLVPVSVNPDGSYATQRIASGMSWSLSNTFSF